jgi:hypothetical protein
MGSINNATKARVGPIIFNGRLTVQGTASFRKRMGELHRCEAGSQSSASYDIMLYMRSLVDPDKCYFCDVRRVRGIKGYRSVIELHHIHEKHLGGTNEAHNMLPLCSNHHSMVHMGLINPVRFYYSTKGWLLEWIDEKGVRYLGDKIW